MVFRHESPCLRGQGLRPYPFGGGHTRERARPNPSSSAVHGDEEVVYADAGYQGIAKRPEMEGKATEFRVAMHPGKRRALPGTPKGRLDDLVETAKAHSAPRVSTHSG